MATPIPKNRAPFSVADVALVARATAILGDAPEPDLAARSMVGVATDSRDVREGELFVALVGERFDGHAHVGAAFERGAVAVLVSRPVDVPAGKVAIHCDDTLVGLGLLGREHRRRWANLPGFANETRGLSPAVRRRTVVGITGSAGKTTTRHAVARVLEALLAQPAEGTKAPRVHASAGNLNNAIGVPMTLLGLEADHALAVVEIGMNSPGEIEHATRMAEPELGIVTLVAEAHTEGVGSYLGVLREKASLLGALDPEGVAMACLDDPGARATLGTTRARARLGYGEHPDAAVRLVGHASRGLDGQSLTLAIAMPGAALRAAPAHFNATIPLLGRAGRYAALAAVTAALAIDPSLAARPEALAAALATIGGNEGGRLHARTRADGTIVIDDAYNANPASMRASLELAGELARGRGAGLVAILGAMYELGARSIALHESIGRAAVEAGARTIVAVTKGDGRALGEAAAALGGDVRYAADAAEAESIAMQAIRPGDVVLVKASNSVGLGALGRRLSG